MTVATPETDLPRPNAFAGTTGNALLEGAPAYPRAPLSYLACRPARDFRLLGNGRVRIDGRESPAGDVLLQLDQFLDDESGQGRTLMGALGYELRHWTEPHGGRFQARSLPILALRSYESTHLFDHRVDRWRNPPPAAAAPEDSIRIDPPRPLLDREAYRHRFERVQAWIAAGDVYQVNLAIPCEAPLQGHPAVLYRRLTRLNPAPYSAYLDFGDFQILSNSPELFLARRGTTIATRPIKGTRPRGATAARDAELVEALRCDPKESAEHVMIVDLERNDLGRIAQTGSVAVAEFRAIETYPTLHHMESLVTAQLRPGLRFSEILKATFPGGSITGAPKTRALQILDALEPEGRGFYTGGILHYPPNGDFTLSLAIRTATVHEGRVEYRAGSGVVADSTSDAEYEECLLKAAAFFAAAGGVT